MLRQHGGLSGLPCPIQAFQYKEAASRTHISGYGASNVRPQLDNVTTVQRMQTGATKMLDHCYKHRFSSLEDHMLSGASE